MLSRRMCLSEDVDARSCTRVERNGTAGVELGLGLAIIKLATRKTLASRQNAAAATTHMIHRNLHTFGPHELPARRERVVAI